MAKREELKESGASSTSFLSHREQIICSKRKQKIANFVTRIFFVEKIDLFHTSLHSKIHSVEYLDKTDEYSEGILTHSYRSHSLTCLMKLKTIQLKAVAEKNNN